MRSSLLFGGALLASVRAYNLDVGSIDSIKSVAASIAKDLVGYYQGNETGQIPGLLPSPYYWWEAGGMFDTLIEYWHLTGDSSYNNIVTQALVFQKGEGNDYMPTNQSKSLGNDDQDFWAFAAMSAAEYQLADPPAGTPSWKDLAINVVESQKSRWDTKTCGGGLRWQVFSFDNGYNYKNSISNGAYFQLASRLASYTGNETYADWAEQVFDWTTAISLIDFSYNVFDGASVVGNCSSINKLQFSVYASTYIIGAAHMYNITKAAPKWKAALDGLLNQTLHVFFPTNDILFEVSCEATDVCNTDMLSFKSYTARWLAATSRLAPYTSSLIMPKLTASAKAAANACQSGPDGTGCAFKWINSNATSKTDFGVGQDMNALAVIQSLLVSQAAGASTNSSGGGSSSRGNSSTSGSGSSASSTTGAAPSSTAQPGMATPRMKVDATRMGLMAGFLGVAACIFL